MKKIVLSALAALTLGSVAASAGIIKLYQDGNGQVFTKPAEGRTEIKADTPVFAKASKLKFSGLTYIGFNYTNYDATLSNGTVNTRSDITQFEIRRAYFQLKAYLLDNPKSYYRITFDVHQDSKINGDTTDGDILLRVKYAYLYLDSVLPNTGVEVGVVHRPWHDYEEHTSWYFRDISKVLVEQKNGANLSNSADFGFNFKTKTKYFDSELGLFNGEGYHSTQISSDMSFEWRTTAHILGVNGKDKEKKLTYWDASFFGQYNKSHKGIDTNSDGVNDRFDDLIFYGLHTVYNQPKFLVAAQYIKSLDTADNGTYVSKQAGEGYSVNAEYRLGNTNDYRALVRYDSWTPTVLAGPEYEQKTYIAGIAWDQNKNIEWVANIDITDNAAGSRRESYNATAYMLTTQVKF